MTTYLQDIDYNVQFIIDNIESGDGAEDAHRYWLAQLWCFHIVMPEAEADQFSDWYSQHPEQWAKVSRYIPAEGVAAAYQVWRRR